MSREHFLNVDFDLSLRHRGAGARGGATRRRIQEMASHVLFAAPPEDSVLVDESVPESFLDYLRARGCSLPAISVRPAIHSAARFTPYGWNREAAELNRRYERPAEHPDLAVVRMVNGRSFGARLAAEVDGDDFELGSFSSEEELTRRLRVLPSSPHGWVLKSEHGNSALGNRRLRGRELAPADRRWVVERLAEDGSLLLEPWCERRADLCVSFDVNRRGEAVGLALHEVVNTADGAFVGALFDRASCLLDHWQAALHGAAGVVARRLADAGYFGPVCMDGFVHGAPERLRLRAVVDVNARHHVSAHAHEWWRGRARGTVGLWRYFVRRKFPRLPSDHEAFHAALGSDALTAGSSHGILLCSPLFFGDGAARRQSHALALFFLARSRSELWSMCRRFRDRWEG